MKLLGATDDGGGRNGPPGGRSQDDAAVGYGFQRHPNEPEFPQFPHKQHRWATGDDTIIDVCVSQIFFGVVFHYFYFALFVS